jgi:hypothetical protein
MNMWTSIRSVVYLKDASTAADLRCTIIEGIQKWFLTDDMNESDEPDPTTQLGRYQVIKGYLPNQCYDFNQHSQIQILRHP